jgi:hypothetical protein
MMEVKNIDQPAGVSYKIEIMKMISISNITLFDMEKRLNKKFEDYITSLKNDIRDKINILDFHEKEKINDLMGFIYDYERLVFKKDDLSKRKRVKNSIPLTNRCNAKRANNEQCTRRKKEGSEYCGTHIKGTPHGLIMEMNESTSNICKMDIIAQEIGGIVYYIDNHTNVYNTEDVMNEKENPEIIAKYTLQNGRYTIPELGLC